MKQFFLGSILLLSAVFSFAQKDETTEGSRGTTSPAVKSKPVVSDNKAAALAANKTADDFTVIKSIPATEVKNQQMTGTCWSFSTTSLVESQAIKNRLGQFDLSEMFTVRNIYIEKAKNYVLRQGNTRFSEGALGHDQIRAFQKYGAMPESVYNGLANGFTSFDHTTMVKDLKAYLDTLLKNRPLKADWLDGFISGMDKTMGTPPESFMYNNKKYTPQSFAREVLQFKADDYVNITSFTHQPYYSPYILEVPDNFSNGMYYNVPLKEMLDLMKTAVTNGYSMLWDADVSNGGFSQKRGMGLNVGGEASVSSTLDPSAEKKWSEQERQRLFENLTTEDDHLMHIVGLEKSKDGKFFYNVKNSWGPVGPFEGFIKVSEAYMAMNTISLVVPKAALSKTLLEKLKL